MSRKPGFPGSTCSIRLPDGNLCKEEVSVADTNDESSYAKRQQLITFGHNQWGFDNWSWVVTKQELDFIDYSNGKYTAGVVAFVSITVKSLGIQREDIGYATCTSSQKGGAIYSSRRCSVTNALRETFLSFGGDVATALLEQLESKKPDGGVNKTDSQRNTTSNKHNELGESQGVLAPNHQHGQPPQRKDSCDSSGSDHRNVKPECKSPSYKQVTSNGSTQEKSSLNRGGRAANHSSNTRVPGPTANHNHVNTVLPSSAVIPPPIAVGGVPPPPVGARPPMPVHPSNVSYVVQRIMPPLYSVQCATPPSPYHNTYFTEYPPWAVSCDNAERHHPIPPKNFISNERAQNECSRSCNVSRSRGPVGEGELNNCSSQPINMNGSWIKPTIFYNGFWTEQKVKKWVSEQNERSSVQDELSSANTGGANTILPPNHNILNQVAGGEGSEVVMLNEEEVLRAERKRRQKQKQEEFKRKLHHPL